MPNDVTAKPPPDTWAGFKASELKAQQAARRVWLKAQAQKFPSLKAMSEGLGIDKTYLARLAQKLGVDLPRFDLSGERAALYRGCARAGLTQAETAKKLGVKRGTVVAAAREYKLSFRREPSKPRMPRKSALPKQTARPETMADFAARENAAMHRAYGGGK